MRRTVGSIILIAVLGLTALASNAGAATRPTITVPLLVFRGHGEVLTAVKLKIEGHPLLFIVDSGAATTTINSRVANELNLPKVGPPLRIEGVGGSARAQRVRITDWTLGGIAMPTDVGVSSNLEIGGGKIVGLLGSDEMSKFGSVKINYKAHTLTLGG